MEQQNCFAYLNENLPLWISRVTDLAAHTATKHAEFSADYTKLSQVKQRKRKNSSIHSIHPGDRLSLGKTVSDRADSISSQTDSPFDNSNKYIQAANRRRKGGVDGASIKSGDNARAGPRARHMVVVHYDSHTQNELERLVRDIGAARNNLRKSRLARIRQHTFGGLGMKLPLINTRNGFKPPPTLDTGSPPPSERKPPFDIADKQLELAQNFCEFAAHQVLRDGDCSSQLGSTREKLESALQISTAEAELMAGEEKAKAELEAELEVEEQPVPEIEADTIKLEESGKLLPHDITAIEVDDDSSASSISIDITAFRSTRFRV